MVAKVYNIQTMLITILRDIEIFDYVDQVAILQDIEERLFKRVQKTIKHTIIEYISQTITIKNLEIELEDEDGDGELIDEEEQQYIDEFQKQRDERMNKYWMNEEVRIELEKHLKREEIKFMNKYYNKGSS